MTPNDMIFGVPPGSFRGSAPRDVRYIRASELSEEETIAGLVTGEVREWLIAGSETWLQLVPLEYARQTVHGVRPDPTLMANRPDDDELDDDSDDEFADDEPDEDDDDEEFDDGSEVDDED